MVNAKDWQLFTSATKDDHYYLLDYQANKARVITIKYKLNLIEIKSIVNAISNPLPETLSENYPLTDNWTLVAVPLHWRSRFKRGFNLNSIVCKKIGQQLGIPVIKALVNQKPMTQGQCRSKAERTKNTRDKFRLKNNTMKKLSSRNVILFDDVVATGSTMKACEKLLKAAGAKKVVWLSIAH